MVCLTPLLPCALQGALLCLAAATVGLGEPSEAYLRQIVPPVLASFTDQDSRVRYYACEALYNIAKVCGVQLVGVDGVLLLLLRCGGGRSAHTTPSGVAASVTAAPQTEQRRQQQQQQDQLREHVVCQSAAPSMQ